MNARHPVLIGILLAGFAAGACGDGTGPDIPDLTGSYNLVTVNGDHFPMDQVLDLRDDGTDCFKQWMGMTLTLEADGTYTRVHEDRDNCDESHDWQTRYEEEVGIYLLSSNQILMDPWGSPVPFHFEFDGRQLRLVVPGVVPLIFDFERVSFAITAAALPVTAGTPATGKVRPTISRILSVDLPV